MLSNFLASLFLGDYAPIDYGDGSMLNLLDIRSHHWFTKCVEVSLAKPEYYSQIEESFTNINT